MLLIKNYEKLFKKEKLLIFLIQSLLSFDLKHFSRIIFIYNITFKKDLGGHLKIPVVL